MKCRVLISIAFAVVVPMLTGCVERRFRIESTPPGAYVYVNNVPYGPTPVDVPFVYYGDYDLTLMKEGFQTKRIKQPVSPPWYQYPPIDFFSESVWPFQVTDARPLHYDLEPTAPPDLDQLRAEANELRRRSRDLPEPRYPPEKFQKGPPPPPAPPPAPRSTNEPPPIGGLP